MGKYVIRNTRSGIKFDLKAADGEVILTSEVYSSLRSCKSGIASVARNAPVAALEDQTAAEVESQKCPKFELYTDQAGEFRFRLKAKNGQAIGAGKGYPKRMSCLNGIESVRRNAASQTEDVREAP